MGSIKKLKYWHAFQQLWTDLVQTYYDFRYCWSQHFATSQSDLDLHSRFIFVREQKLLCYLTNFSVSLDGVWHSVWTCWSYEHHTHFMLSEPCARERIILLLFHKQKQKQKKPTYRFLRHFKTDFFQTWYDNRDQYAIHFDVYQVWWPWSYSRSQMWKKSKTAVPIFSHINSHLIWMKFSMLPQPVGLLKLTLHLFHILIRKKIQCREMLLL